jgi:spermidine synthase
MYHVIGTGLTAILLYLISYIFYRIGYFPHQFHKKFWNSLLAIAFIVTALAGVFMALQINYKWNVPFVKSILKWHVEFGIGMAVTGIFHFIWHLSYYGKMFGNSDMIPETVNIQKLTSSEISTNLFVVGFVSASIQLLLIREMMNIAGGYELITGIFLGSWLIGSAIGASLAGKSTLTDIRRINLIFSMSPVISLFLLLLLSRLFLNNGETPSLLVSIIYTFLVLIPFCLVSGFTFVRLISVARAGNNFIPGKSFSIETAGGIVSGITITLLTAGVLNTYQLLLIIIILANVYVYLSFWISSFKVKISAKILVTVLAAAIIIFNPDTYFRHILLPGIIITSSEDTPYGNITKGKYKGEESTYYNQRLLSYKNDVAEREEDIHYAMLQCESPEKVIIISGSLKSHLPEILKYPVKKIIYIERDPALTRSGDYLKDSLPAALIISNNDAFRYIRSQIEKVDVIILLTPPPSTLLLNRYYTTEFFTEAKKRLNKGGVFMCSPGPGDNYLNKESLNLYSSVYNSLTGVFKNVIPIAGNKLYFIASDNELSSSVCHLAYVRKIRNIYVSSDFLSDDLITKKSDEIISLMDHGVRQNTSAFPVACFHFQSYNFSKNLNEKIPAIALLIMLFAFPVMAIKRRNLLMYFSASALAGFEIIVLLTMQLIIGNMYQLTGLIIAGLMAGLAVGAGLNSSFMNSFSLRMKCTILICFYIGIGLIFHFMLLLRSGFPAIILLVLSAFLPALVTGNIFRELTFKSAGDTASSATYSADLAGSAFGFILMSGFAVPLFGIKVSIFLLSGLILAGILFGTVRNK